MARNPIVRNILISRQPRDEYVKYVMKCVSRGLKEHHDQVDARAMRQGEDIQTKWRINDQIIEVILESDVLASLETEPFAIDEAFIRAFERNDVRLGPVKE